MPYRAPELFNVESYCMVDERTDIWVRESQNFFACFNINDMCSEYIFNMSVF